MRTLLIAFAFVVGSVGASEPASFQGASASTHPARYSFVDVYRLTVSGALAGQPLVETTPDEPVRIALAHAQPAEARFSISQVRQPEKWLLILAGLALAGWVAHRRLAHAL